MQKTRNEKEEKEGTVITYSTRWTTIRHPENSIEVRKIKENKEYNQVKVTMKEDEVFQTTIWEDN